MVCPADISRYGNPSQLSADNGDEYQAFSAMFLADFAPDILRAYLSEIEKWAAKSAWLSRHCLASTITFLDECIKPKATWDLLRPHLETIVRHVIFPVMCISDTDIELFEDDPAEYIQKKFTYYDEVSSPDMAANSFLITLTQQRKKQTFTVLAFINETVNAYEAAPENERDPKQKEGALRMTGTLAPVMLGKKSPIANQVEYFFVRHVFPEFRSPRGYLRARACDMVEKFQELKFENQDNLITVYTNILESMADRELPVRLEAALALQPLIKHEIIKEFMQQTIPAVMQQLLSLANEVDVDALANVMEEFVEVFAAELTPFAVALTEQLRDTYLRIMGELVERAKGSPDTISDLYDDKSITALGVLQTIGTLFLTLESTPDVMLHLETILMPIIEITLENKLFDLFNEVFEIIDSCTFSAKSISETMWQAFELIHRTFKDGAELYLEDMLPALENYISYGRDRLICTPVYVDAIVSMVETIFTEKRAGGVDRICGCKLAEGLMIHLRGNIDRYIQPFLSIAMNTLLASDSKVKSLKIHLMEMVINAIYYNPRIALPWLEANQWTNRFFSMWFAQLDLFTRVHDKKLSIAAIVACLGLGPDEIPVSIQIGWPRLLSGAVRLFQTLPAAVKKREEAVKQDTSGESALNSLGGDDDDEWSNEVVWDDADADDLLENGDTDATEDVKSDPYLEFLTQEAKRIGSVNGLHGAATEDDDELEEENLLESPLDRIEPYALFRNVLLSKSSPQSPPRPHRCSLAIPFHSSSHANPPTVIYRLPAGTPTSIPRTHPAPLPRRNRSTATGHPHGRSQTLKRSARSGSGSGERAGRTTRQCKRRRRRRGRTADLAGHERAWQCGAAWAHEWHLRARAESGTGSGTASGSGPKSKPADDAGAVRSEFRWAGAPGPESGWGRDGAGVVTSATPTIAAAATAAAAAAATGTTTPSAVTPAAAGPATAGAEPAPPTAGTAATARAIDTEIGQRSTVPELLSPVAV